MLIKIKNLVNGDLIMEIEADNLKKAIEILAKDGANLHEADLRGANLRGANLYGANLRGANLRGANLRGANLRGADLYEANLRGAYLRGAYLYGANLYGANLYGANLYGANLRGANLYEANLYGADLRGAYLGECGKLTDKRPFITIGPIGSRQDYLQVFTTEKGIFLKTGCFSGSIEAFEKELSKKESEDKNLHEYIAALNLVHLHHELWK